MNSLKPIEKSMDVLHFEHERWAKQLEFYTDELKIFTSRLEEISDRYTNEEVLAKLEHFQNQFMIQRNEIDILEHDIKQHENILINAVNQNPNALELQLFNDHGELRDKMETFVKIYNELKNEYMRYLSRYM